MTRPIIVPQKPSCGINLFSTWLQKGVYICAIYILSIYTLYILQYRRGIIVCMVYVVQYICGVYIARCIFEERKHCNAVRGYYITRSIHLYSIHAISLSIIRGSIQQHIYPMLFIVQYICVCVCYVLCVYIARIIIHCILCISMRYTLHTPCPYNVLQSAILQPIEGVTYIRLYSMCSIHTI